MSLAEETTALLVGRILVREASVTTEEITANPDLTIPADEEVDL